MGGCQYPFLEKNRAHKFLQISKDPGQFNNCVHLWLRIHVWLWKSATIFSTTCIEPHQILSWLRPVCVEGKESTALKWCRWWCRYSGQGWWGVGRSCSFPSWGVHLANLTPTRKYSGDTTAVVREVVRRTPSIVRVWGGRLDVFSHMHCCHVPGPFFATFFSRRFAMQHVTARPHHAIA